MIRVQDLSHRYPCGRQAIRSLTLTLNASESVALVGPNGAGKTTFLLRLCGVLPGAAGQAFLDGLDTALPSNRLELPKRVGLVFQNPDDQLFSPTLYDDVAFGPLNLKMTDVPDRVEAALAAVGLSGQGDRTPHRMSAGEKRRAALATVLAMQPAALLLDEPTMALDPRGRREFVAVLKSLTVTKLIATHDLDLVRDVCDRVLLVNDGVLVADGATKAILENETLMRQLL